MKTFALAILVATTFASGTAFGQRPARPSRGDVRSFSGQREMNRLIYGDPSNPRQPATPEEEAAAAKQAAALAAKNHVEDVRQKAREGYAAWSGKIARADKITQTNAKRQAVKIARAEKIVGDDAATYVAEFAGQAPVAK
jgi:hypothetical protein